MTTAANKMMPNGLLLGYRQWGTTNKSQSYTAFPIAYTKFAVKCYSPTNPNEYSGVIITTSNTSHDISLTGINIDPSTYGRDYFTLGF